MPRFTFFGEATHVPVSEDATNVGTTTPARKALTLNPGVAAFPLYLSPGGTLANDFRLFNSSTGAYDVPATSISTLADGYPPACQGPDGVRVLYDAAGKAYVCWEGASSTGAAIDESGLVHKAGAETITGSKTFSNAPVVPVNAFTADRISDFAAAVRSVLGLTVGQTVATLQGDNEFTGTNAFAGGSIPAAAIGADLDQRIASYNTSQGIYKIRTYPNGGTAGTTPETVYYEEAAGAPATPAAALVSHQGTGSDLTTYAFTPELAMPAASVYYVGVWGQNATTTPAAKASTVTGRGLTWTAVGTGGNTSGGTLSLIIFRGVGTPTSTGNITVTFPSAMEGCHIELVAVSAVGSGAPVASAYGTGTTTAPSVALAAAPTATLTQLLFVGWNTTTNTITTDPGTPFGSTPDVTSTGMTTRASARISSAQQTNTWAKSGTAQPVTGTVVVPAS